MLRINDNDLIEELKQRFAENKGAFNALREMTKKLEDLNQRLSESEALKSNFLSNIKNEINNPLSAIMGISEELISMEPFDKEMVSSMANMIHLEAFSLDSQLRNIFAAAEFEAGEAVFSPANSDIDTLINGTVNSLKQKAANKEVTVHYKSLSESGSDSHFKTDPEKMQLIVSNLLGNAIEYSKAGEDVEVSAWIDQDNLNVSVKDSGEGIDNEQQKEIFDRFRQLDSGSTKTHLGHGLGLSVTKAAAELMNGTVSLESTKGKGSLFTSTIPEAIGETDMEMTSEDSNQFIFDDVEEF